jgi:OFA family oxalate/formate antiporter-like MFS transporter
MIVAWSIGGVVGPQIAATLIGSDKNYVLAYTTIGVIAFLALILPAVTKLPRTRQSATDGRLAQEPAH